MNNIELNAILYYADFLSLKAISQPVTDNCKYFFIHNVPINSLYIIDMEPIYDEENPYFQQAWQEYQIIRDKFGEDGVESFIEDICSIRACGSVDAERMLKCIHQYSSRMERRQAFNTYYTWAENQTYKHEIKDEDGNPKETSCTKYFKHAEIASTRRKLLKSTQED